jgi:hypothetical protein
MRQQLTFIRRIQHMSAYVSTRQHTSAYVSTREQLTFIRRIHAVQPPRREFVSEGMRPVALLHCDGKRLLYFAQALQEYKKKQGKNNKNASRCSTVMANACCMSRRLCRGKKEEQKRAALL